MTLLVTVFFYCEVNIMEENKKSTKGGARAGAGRPKGIKKPYAQIVCSVPKEYSEKLREMAEKEGLSLSKMLQKIIDGYVKNGNE